VNRQWAVKASDYAGLSSFGVADVWQSAGREPDHGVKGDTSWLWIGRRGGCRMLLFDDERVYGLIVMRG
jgi:hypothetical protein